jgi:hypothetical protein
LEYLKWQDIYLTEKPYLALMDVPEGVRRSNMLFEDGPVEEINDIRGREDQFDLDTHGFMIRKCPLQTKVFDRESIESLYLKEVESLIYQEIADVEKVVCFNWQV